MSSIPVHFTYHIGLKSGIFRNVRLVGSWDANGSHSDQWTGVPMRENVSDSGCPCFRATVNLNGDQAGWTFSWGILLDGPGGANRWGITTEVHDRNSSERFRSFQLKGPEQVQEYYLTHCRRLGANKLHRPGGGEPAVRFAVWAPNALNVEMVRGDAATGYIDDNGTGVLAAFPMHKETVDGTWTGIWRTDDDSEGLESFAQLDHTPYMFRITKDDNTVRYRTDLYSRCQIGSGKENPGGKEYEGSPTGLAGSVSCSVVVDPERVTELFDEPFPQKRWLDADEFWKNEFDPLRPVPTRIDDLVIYEMHVPGLGCGKTDAAGEPLTGDLKDAVQMLDYLVDLGVNAVEILPMNEFEGWAAWGYATSHYFAVEYAGGGRDQFKHFVRECHRRGLAVVLDVVYNHYAHNAERAEWMYDSNRHERNIYYWYEGMPSDYRDYEHAAGDPTIDARKRPASGHGGYVDNMSTGYAPRFHEEMVRKMFISSAAALVHEFHVDGFRVDQTTSIHSYAVVHADGRAADDARVFGAKFLRELTRTLKLIKPTVMLIAEDHSGWSAVTEPPDKGGLGFDAYWYADFYHHLIGDTDKGSDYAKLIKTCGLGDDRPLAIDYFVGALRHAGNRTVVYHESHDEAGNAKFSGRTIAVAVNRATLSGETRRWAEARCRLACGLNMLSPGIPMFFMGEEVGFQKDYPYDLFLNQREDFLRERSGNGANLFRFYQDIIKLRRRKPALRTAELVLLHVRNDNRVLVFRRSLENEHFVVFASFNNSAFADGYRVNEAEIPDGAWREVFNSDAAVYGGNNVGNGGMVRQSRYGSMDAVIPANGFVVFERL